MATTEERLKILNMVQEGKITPEDAAQLLEAINSAPAAQTQRTAQPNSAEDLPGLGRKPRWLRVRVTDTDSGKPRVNVRLPISMVSVGLKMGSKFAPQIEGLDASELMQIIESGELARSWMCLMKTMENTSKFSWNDF
ncbi:MAG: hypothetical protein IH586_17095 [Anaerolineaceae bacterium]|nr:hypothetical protein [Anaerolineaceae bacterium]